VNLVKAYQGGSAWVAKEPTHVIVGFSSTSVIDDSGALVKRWGPILIHQTSPLGFVDPWSNVVALVGPVVEQAQCDLGGQWLVVWVAHYNKWYQNPDLVFGKTVGFSATPVIDNGVIYDALPMEDCWVLLLVYV
jgi:hypothetical protein